MNNAYITSDQFSLEDNYDPTPSLRAEESRLVRLLEAIDDLQQSVSWSTLQELLFKTLPESLEKELKEEARKDAPDPQKLNRLAGQLEWAERYADLAKLRERYRMQLQAIKTRLNATP